MQQENRPGSGSVPPLSSVDRRLESWRTPAVILACGCLISMIGFGPRSTLGFFLTPMSTAHGWGREVFALSVAIQTLLYGIAQPFSGAIADRFGTVRVIIAGTLLYAAGIFMMAHAATPETLFLSSGVLIGFGLSGCSFNLVISSFGKLLPESWRSLAFGAGTASGSFGQFLFSPLAVGLVDTVGWRTTLEVFAGLLLLIVPLAFAIATPRSDAPAQTSVRSLRKLDCVPGMTIESVAPHPLPAPPTTKRLRRRAGLAAEEAGKVRGVGERQVVGDLLDRLVGENELALGFGQDALADQMPGGHAGRAFHMIVEPVRRHRQPVGVERQQAFLAEMLFDDAA